MTMHRVLRLRVLALTTVVLASGCALVLDLPSPALQSSIGADGGASDAAGSDGGVGGDGATTGDGALCDLSLPQNCGACGIDCSGGKCTGGVCMLTSGYGGSDLRSPYGLTVVGDDVYVAVYASNAVGIGRCSTRGCQSTGMTPFVPYDESTTTLQPTKLIHDDAGTLGRASATRTTRRTASIAPSSTDRRSSSTRTTCRSQWAASSSRTTTCSGRADEHGRRRVRVQEDGLRRHADPRRHGRRGAATAVTSSLPPTAPWAMAGKTGELAFCSSATCADGGLLIIANGNSDLATDGKYVYFQTYDAGAARAQIEPPTTGRTVLVEASKLPPSPARSSS
ncbi:MAG: hypothetical protein U0235_19595 [Polyangiaceae bacterium]